MALDEVLGVEGKLLDRAVGEVRQFAAEHSVVQQPQQQRRGRLFGLLHSKQQMPKQIPVAPGDSLYWAKEIYDWMQANFAEEVVFGHHPNLAFESRGVEHLTGLIKDSPRHKGIDVSNHYKASGLGQAAIYAILAERLGLEARVVFDDVELPALGFVSSMDEPVRKGTGRLYSVAITAADNEGRAGEVRVLPYYRNGFGIDLTGEVVLDNNPLLTVAPKRAFEPSEKAITALIRAGQASFLDIEEASRHYDKALEELGHDVKTLYDYAEAVRSAGMHSIRLSEKATRLFQRVLELDPSHSGAKDFIKYAEKAAVKAKAELEYQKRMVANNPNDVGAALFLYYLLRHEGAEEGFTLAEQLLRSGKAESYSDWMQLANDHYKLRGDVTKAVEILSEGVKQFPGDTVLHYDLGNLLFALGRWEEAAQQLEHSIAGHFESTKNNYFAVANAVQGKFSEAAGLFRLGLKENPYYKEIRRNLAVVQFWQGDFESTEQAKKELLDNVVRGKDVISMLYLGAIYQKQGMKRLAFDYYLRALEMNPELEAARTLLKSATNGLTLEEALEPLRPKMTGFRPNMQPKEKRYRSLDFTPVKHYDAAGRLDEALAELDRLADEAARPGEVKVNNAGEIQRYRQLIELRKRALESVGAENFFSSSHSFPKLIDYRRMSGGIDDKIDEVVVRGNLGNVTLSIHPTVTSMTGCYTRITPDPFAQEDNDQLIAAVVSPEDEVETLEKLAKPAREQQRTYVIENLHGSLCLKPNTYLTLETVVGSVTGEVGLVDGKINVGYGDINLHLREPIEVVVGSGTAVVENMVKVNGNVYAPLNSKTGSPVRSDFRLVINTQHGQVRIAYQPYKAAN